MQPLKIKTETESITKYKAFLLTAIVPLQAFYDQFKAIDINVTIESLHSLSTYANSTEAKSSIDYYVSNKLLDKVGTPDFGGVPIKRDKLREMLDIPTTVNIVKQADAVKAFAGQNHQYWLETKYFEIVNDKVVIKTDAFQEIEERYTHYTKNDRGVMIFTKLNGFIPQLNNYLKAIDGRTDSANYMKGFNLEEIGVNYEDGEFRPSLNFIRNQERSYPNFIAS